MRSDIFRLEVELPHPAAGAGGAAGLRGGAVDLARRMRMCLWVLVGDCGSKNLVERIEALRCAEILDLSGRALASRPEIF